MVKTSDPPASSPDSNRPTMWRTASRAVKKAPSRLTRSTRRHSSAVMSRKLGARPGTPALTKHESMRPSSPTVSAIAAVTASSSPTSHTTAITSPPWAAICSTATSFLVALVPHTATAAPCSANPAAIPNPMPLLPPVTSATWPLRSKSTDGR